MSDETDEGADRTFERWALAGACVLALVGIAAFLARRDAREAARSAADDDARSEDLVRVRIGGDRPPTVVPQPDDRGGDDHEITWDPPPPGPDDRDAPLPPDPTPAPRTVVVQPGETLGQIAQRELGTVRRLPEILELNGIDDADLVRAGTKLKIPPR